MTTSLTPEKHSPYQHHNHASSSNSTSRKKSPSALFPFSLVLYESGGLLGINKTNTSTVCSTNAASPIVAPGTILPPGTIVSTGVPILAPPTSFSTPPNMPTISLTPSCGSVEFPGSPVSSPSGEEGPTTEILLSEKVGFGNAGFALPYDHYPTYQHDQGETMSSSASSVQFIEDGSSQVLVKSHVAVYEINARELKFCEDGHEAHGNWCGPSGVDGAPYMLTVGLSMWTFGLYALTHLRTPTSRLVGYSGK
ncbi:hypothetical protein CPB97_011586 [Podila verticillata]|nr:hypothetical protein CPB97_011586 [Podila verticillata]